MKAVLTSPIFWAVISYLLILPLVLYGFSRIQKWFMIDRPASKIKNRADLEKLPPPAWGIWKQRINFTRSDKRSVTIGKKSIQLERRQLFFILYLLGLVFFIVGAFWKPLVLIPLGIVTFFASIIFGVKSSKSLMTERERIMGRMLEVGVSKLGLPKDSQIGDQVKVLEWEDFTSPQKVEYTVPTTFSQTGAEGFLLQFNQVFGNTQEWIPSKDEGWDFDKGKVTLAAVPPLPTMAPWAEHYVLADGIADSFFPMALSVQGGVEITNPETGEQENVIGFDVGGKQRDEGKKANIKVDKLLGTASPQTLIAGHTGSGKAIAIDELIKVFVPNKHSDKD